MYVRQLVGQALGFNSVIAPEAMFQAAGKFFKDPANSKDHKNRVARDIESAFHVLYVSTSDLPGLTKRANVNRAFIHLFYRALNSHQPENPPFKESRAVETDRRKSYFKLLHVEKKKYRMCGSDLPNRVTMAKLAEKVDSSTARTRPTFAFKCFAGDIPRYGIELSLAKNQKYRTVVLQRNEQHMAILDRNARRVARREAKLAKVAIDSCDEWIVELADKAVAHKPPPARRHGFQQSAKHYTAIRQISQKLGSLVKKAKSPTLQRKPSRKHPATVGRTLGLFHALRQLTSRLLETLKPLVLRKVPQTRFLDMRWICRLQHWAKVANGVCTSAANIAKALDDLETHLKHNSDTTEVVLPFNEVFSKSDLNVHMHNLVISLAEGIAEFASTARQNLQFRAGADTNAPDPNASNMLDSYAAFLADISGRVNIAIRTPEPAQSLSQLATLIKNC
jgi:hypothetical protein